jgi:hypothetical protein
MFLLLMFLLLLLFGVWRHARVIGHCTAHCSKRIFSLPGDTMQHLPLQIPMQCAPHPFISALFRPTFTFLVPETNYFQIGDSDWFMRQLVTSNLQLSSLTKLQQSHKQRFIVYSTLHTHTHTQILFHIKEFVTNTITLLNLSHCTRWFSLYWEKLPLY